MALSNEGSNVSPLHLSLFQEIHLTVEYNVNCAAHIHTLKHTDRHTLPHTYIYTYPNIYIHILTHRAHTHVPRHAYVSAHTLVCRHTHIALWIKSMQEDIFWQRKSQSPEITMHRH